MSKRNLYLEITNSIWLIEESYANAQFLLVDSLLKGNINAFDKKNAKAKFISVDYLGQISASVSGIKPFSNAAPDSTAVIYVSGPIMKHDNCVAPGTKTYSSLINDAAANPNIGSLLIVYDTPGGTVAGTEEFANAVKSASAQMPVISLVDGLLCSAGYWSACGSTEIYGSNKTDQIGSIGTMCSFADTQGAYEKQGVVFHDIYADASKDKNKDIADARKGNYDAIKLRLNSINDLFIGAVNAGRGEKLNKKETLSGKVFMTADAINNGLIDGMKTFEEALARAQELVQSNNNNNNQNQKSTMKVKAMFATMTAFLASVFTGFKADETVLTEEHLTKIDAELATLATEKLAKVAAETAKGIAETALAVANASVTKLTADLATAIGVGNTAAAKVVELQAEIDRLSVLNPGATSPLKTKTDVVTAEEKDDFSCEVDEELKAVRTRMGYAS